MEAQIVLLLVSVSSSVANNAQPVRTKNQTSRLQCLEVFDASKVTHFKVCVAQQKTFLRLASDKVLARNIITKGNLYCINYRVEVGDVEDSGYKIPFNALNHSTRTIYDQLSSFGENSFTAFIAMSQHTEWQINWMKEYIGEFQDPSLHFYHPPTKCVQRTLQTKPTITCFYYI